MSERQHLQPVDIVMALAFLVGFLVVMTLLYLIGPDGL